MHIDPDLLHQAQVIQDIALELGAQEVAVSVGSTVYTQMSQREGRIEKCEQSRSIGVGLSLLVDGRYSSHSTSDPSPASMTPFLKRAIDATKYLEEDPHRGHLLRDQMGSADISSLDALDAYWSERTPEERKADLQKLEESCIGHTKENSKYPVRSVTAHIWDSYSKSVKLFSNGHSCGWSRTSFGQGAELTLVENKTLEDGSNQERLPEAYDFYSVRHFEDIPQADDIAKNLLLRGHRRVGSKAVASEQLPMLLENRVVGRLLRSVLGPLSARNIYEKRSCMIDKKGTQIGSSHLNIYENPLIPRGVGSSPYTGDGMEKKRAPIIQDGVLCDYFIDVYNGRRLHMAPNSLGTSNVVIDPSDQSVQSIVQSLPRCIRVEGFLGGNSNALTGDFSFGITGTLFEKGIPIQGVSEMNISGNIFDLLSKYQIAANDVWTFGSYRTPSLLFDAIQFSGT